MNTSSTVLIPNAPSYHGHVYVIQFSDQTIKVGRTRRPRHRIRAHQDDAAKFGIRIENVWLSRHHVEYKANERDLISHMHSLATLSAGSEYFTGGSFSDATAYAQSLPTTAWSQAEVALREEEDRRRSNAMVDAWMGDRKTPDVPPVLSMLFSDFSQLFDQPVEMMGPNDSAHSVMEMVALLAKATDGDEDSILDSSYIKMVGRVAKTIVETQVLKLEVWALQEDRDDLLATYREAIAGGAA